MRGLDPAALHGLERRERLLLLWEWMTDAARQRCWERLSLEQRMDFIALVFDATQVV